MCNFQSKTLINSTEEMNHLQRHALKTTLLLIEGQTALKIESIHYNGRILYHDREASLLER